MNTENIFIDFNLIKGEFFQTSVNEQGTLTIAKDSDDTFFDKGYWISEKITLSNTNNFIGFELLTIDGSNSGISVYYRYANEEEWRETGDQFELLEELQGTEIQVKVELELKEKLDVNNENSLYFSSAEALELVSSHSEEQEKNFQINNEKLVYSPSTVIEKSGSRQGFRIDKTIFEKIGDIDFIAPFGDSKLRVGNWETEGAFPLINNLEETLDTQEVEIDDLLYNLLGTGEKKEKPKKWFKWTAGGSTLLMPTTPIAFTTPLLIHEQKLASGETTIKIGVHTFKVRLLKGLNDEAAPASLDTKFSEWNRLILPFVNNGQWNNPNNVESNLDTWKYATATDEILNFKQPMLVQETYSGIDNEDVFVVRNKNKQLESVATISSESEHEYILPWYPVLEYVQPERSILFRKDGLFGWYNGNGKFSSFGFSPPPVESIENMVVKDLKKLQEDTRYTQEHMENIGGSGERELYKKEIDLTEHFNLIKIEVKTND